MNNLSCNCVPRLDGVSAAKNAAVAVISTK